MMKTATHADGIPIAQGDVIFLPVDHLPQGFLETKDMVVAHSETGHHHVAVGPARRFVNANDVMRSFIVARGPVQVEHRRPFDTHETIELRGDAPEVIWEIRRQREWSPEGWRRVED